MNHEITFPQDLTAFLEWIKVTTETYYSNLPPEAAMHGAKWLPLTDIQIDGLEEKYAIHFDVEHRAFLKVLHTLDKNYEEEKYEEETWEEERVLTPEEQAKCDFWHPPYRPSLFYNWITEPEWIASRLAWIEDRFITDILGVNGSWLKSWGPCPDADEEKISIFKAWYEKAPRFLPLTAHTFLMADAGYGLKPVLSVWGFDTAIQGWSLRHYLLREFGDELGLMHVVHDYDEESDYTYVYKELNRGIPELEALQTIKLNDAVIHHWKEVVVYYCYPFDRKCWQGFWVEPDYPIKP
ncbi:hypothetical protein F3J22_17860 [Chitinophaga sp. Cy-1792]|nr:hypothetical protein [Chitinophaga sp. Cy-1792]